MRIEKDQLFISNMYQNFLFHKSRGAGHLASYALNRFQWFAYPSLGIVPDFPLHVDIETSTHCDMSCPMCYRRTERFQKEVESRFMEYSLYEKIIEECARRRLFSIRLSLRGEAFLHPRIFDCIELAKKSGIKEVSSLTNGLALNPEKFEKLVRLAFDWLTISFDGLGRTYESIRKPADFSEALEKIKSYARIKKRYRSSKPALRIQCVWPAIKDNVAEFYAALSAHVDSITSNPLIDFLEEDTDIPYDTGYKCPYLYQRMVIAVDGRVLLCAGDEYGEYIIGDVTRSSIHDIWHGQKMRQARDWFAKKNRRWWERGPCSHCCYPRQRAAAGTVNVGGRAIEVKKYANRPDNLKPLGK